MIILCYDNYLFNSYVQEFGWPFIKTIKFRPNQRMWLFAWRYERTFRIIIRDCVAFSAKFDALNLLRDVFRQDFCILGYFFIMRVRNITIMYERRNVCLKFVEASVDFIVDIRQVDCNNSFFTVFLMGFAKLQFF